MKRTIAGGRIFVTEGACTTRIVGTNYQDAVVRVKVRWTVAGKVITDEERKRSSEAGKPGLETGAEGQSSLTEAGAVLETEVIEVGER